MSKKLTTKGEWAKHLRPYGKRLANKKHRKAHKISLSCKIEVFSAIKKVCHIYHIEKLISRSYYVPLVIF